MVEADCVLLLCPLQPSAKVQADVLAELLRPSIDYVRHKKFRSGNFPSSLSNESDRLVHWCHGAPGVVHMLITAHKVSVDSHCPLWNDAALQHTLWSPKVSKTQGVVMLGDDGHRDATAAWTHKWLAHTHLSEPLFVLFISSWPIRESLGS